MYYGQCLQKPDVVTSKTPMDESSDSSWKPEPYEGLSEGSSSDDSLDGWLVSEDGVPVESEEAHHQSGDSGSTKYIFNEPGNIKDTGAFDYPNNWAPCNVGLFYDNRSLRVDQLF